MANVIQRTLSSVSSRSATSCDPLSGHLGHLSDQQSAALAEFKLLCEDKGLYKPGNDDTEATHDDATLL